MQIDIARFKTDGQAYTDELIEAMQNEAWENLKFSKLQNSGPEELELMHRLWSHGFMKGAESATRLSITLYEAINAQPKQ